MFVSAVVFVIFIRASLRDHDVLIMFLIQIHINSVSLNPLTYFMCFV